MKRSARYVYNFEDIAHSYSYNAMGKTMIPENTILGKPGTSILWFLENNQQVLPSIENNKLCVFHTHLAKQLGIIPCFLLQGATKVCQVPLQLSDCRGISNRLFFILVNLEKRKKMFELYQHWS